MAAKLHVFCSLTAACAVLILGFRGILAQVNSDIAVLVRSPVATSSELATTITVYRGDVQRMVTFDKAVLLGTTFYTHRLQFRNNNPRIPNEAISSTSTEPATLTLPVTMTTAERTGIYSITVTEDDGTETVLRVLVTNEDGEVFAVEYSTVVSQGDQVTMRAVPGTGVQDNELRWRRDGVFAGSDIRGMSFPTITAGNSEVFECFKSGRYSQNIHAIMNLVVRGCPKDKTGEGCGEECHRCFNGGVCSDEIVSCLCPPGFSGDNCESVHGRNVFGQNAEYQCDDTADDHSDGCEGAIICYPEPFGCTCPAGYMGIDCIQECNDGKFGANCKQDCHCQNGVSCSKDTGECDNNQCADGWKGVNCQVEVPCEVGWFGDMCTQPCACPSGPCNDVESNCDPGCAATWTGVACDENSGSGVITDLTYVKVNPGVLSSVTCSAIRNPVLGQNELNLQVSGGVPATLSSSSVSGERQYTRSSNWTVTLQSDPVVTAFCFISGTTTSQSVQLVPYELLQYSPDRSALLSFSIVLNTSILIAWPPWLDGIDLGDGPIKEYVIQYREEGVSTFTEGVRTASSVTQITGLNVDTLYEFRIVLVRDGPNGDGPPSDSQAQRTLCGVISMLPSLTLAATTARAATFRSEIPPMDEWKCSSITASLQRQQSDGQWVEVQSLSTTSGTVTVSGLIPCTSYIYRVQVDNTESIANSMPEDVRTQPEALVVSDLSVSAATRGQLDISWSPQDTSGTNCVLYTVMYRLVRHVACGSDVTESMYMTETTTSTSITLSDLNDYAEYDVIVRADGEVDGTQVSGVGRTLQAVPSAAPGNISVSNILSTCLNFTWEPPPCDQRNGDIVSHQYSLYFFNGVTNDTAVPETSTEATQIDLCGLTPDFEYYFKVRASTSVGQGPDSEVVTIRTEKDELSSSGVSLVVVVVVAVVLVIAVIVFFVVTVVIVRRKIVAKRSKDGIHVYADAGKQKGSFGDIAMKSKSGKPGIQLESGDYDETEVKPSGRKTENRESGYLEPSFTTGVESKATGQHLERGSHVYMEPAPVSKNEYETCRNPLSEDGYENSVIRDHGISVKKLENSVKRKLPATPQTGSLHNPSETYEVPDIGISHAKADVPCSIRIRDLPDCLQNKDMNPEDTVGDEFSKLLQGKQHPWTVGALKDEHPSSGILPYDHSRVKLEKNSSDSNFDYYNANFIKDQHNEKGFVAAQGPTAKTLKTFWRMIWDHNIEMIINLTEVNEAAQQYWPSGIGTNQKYADLTVIWCDNLVECCDFSVRELKVIKGDKVHEVKLCHFLSWPEASFPLQPAVVLDFIKKVKASRKKLSLPMLVHCSNGVGATGTFIAIYSLLEGVKDTRKSRGNVFDFVTKMRKNRVDMVQNESQYTFVYETLTSALLTTETAMSEENLLEMDFDLQKDLLVKQHEALTALTKVLAPRRSLVGQSQENASKNRFQKVIPLDSCRVTLKSPGCFVGSNDYINASLVNSPYLRDGFIMTQAPLATTVEDFWRMIYDYQCAAIVSLNEMNENNEEVCSYMPDGGKVQYGNMSVRCTNITAHRDAYIERQLIVKHRKCEKEVPLHHYQLLTWPEAKHQHGALLEILFKVQPLMKSKQRVAVHCLDGVKRSGIFVAVATEIMYAKTNKEVDLFRAVHKLRGKTPNVVMKLEDYCLCYQLLKSSSAAEESAYASIGE